MASASLPMCKTQRVFMASDPKPRSSSHSSSFLVTNSGSYRRTTTSLASYSSWAIFADSKASSTSLIALRDSLLETPTLYPFAELCTATNNFLARRLTSSSSSSWQCSLRDKDAIIFQHPFRGDSATLPTRLAAIYKGHHSNLSKPAFSTIIHRSPVARRCHQLPPSLPLSPHEPKDNPLGRHEEDE